MVKQTYKPSSVLQKGATAIYLDRLLLTGSNDLPKFGLSPG